MTKKTTKTVTTQAEFSAVITSYETNGFKIKSQSENECVLTRKTKGKRWSFRKLALVKFVVACCTLFIVPILYNVLHTKKEEVKVVLKAA